MSWLFSRALVAVSSGDISSDGVLYATAILLAVMRGVKDNLTRPRATP